MNAPSASTVQPVRDDELDTVDGGISIFFVAGVALGIAVFRPF